MNAPLPARLWNLWEMLKHYRPVYDLATNIERLRRRAEISCGDGVRESQVDRPDRELLHEVLNSAIKVCPDYGLDHTAEMAKRVLSRDIETAKNRLDAKTYSQLLTDMIHLRDSLAHELEIEAVVRLQRDRKEYFEQKNLFGPEVADAFPSCERDIERSGTCYALDQGDACVHHLMMILERGLNALADKLGVAYAHRNWQNVIEENASKLKTRGPDFDFHRKVNGEFGFLKDVYRNDSEHARDMFYDAPGALSVLNHVRSFMQLLAKNGLRE